MNLCRQQPICDTFFKTEAYRKVKAHLKLEDATNGDFQLEADIRANGNGEHCAKQGAKCHPQPSKRHVDELKRSQEDVNVAIKVRATLLPLWPREPGLPRVLREPKEAEISSEARLACCWRQVAVRAGAAWPMCGPIEELRAGRVSMALAAANSSTLS